MDDRTTDPPGGDEPPQPPVPRTGEDGQPVYDQEFFLALARCGKDVWNLWRESNPDIAVTFRGVDFRLPGNAADFEGFHFGNDADLSGAVFREKANFSNSQFGNQANLSGVFFGESTNFSHVTFGDSANFLGAIFGDYAVLAMAKFGDFATLRCAVFGVHANFSGAEFGDHANFFSTTLHTVALFSGAKFRGDVFFGATSPEFWTTLINSVIRSWPESWQKRFHTHHAMLHEQGAAHYELSNVKFDHAEFEGAVDFHRRTFLGDCNFTNARFSTPPLFGECEGGGNIDFYGASIGFSSPQRPRLVRGWTSRSDIALRLRAMRKFAEDTKNHDLERDLYIEERRAERGIVLARYWRGGWRSLLKLNLYSYCVWIAVMAGFSLLADYGRRFVRPLAALAISVFVFWWTYVAVLLPPTDPTKLADFHRATWAFAISNAVPFVGALTLERDVKLTLLCGDRPIDKEHVKNNEPLCVPIPGRRFQLLALGQSIFSALCIFFAGLALRNYFKLR